MTKPATAINLIILLLPCLRYSFLQQGGKGNLSIIQAKLSGQAQHACEHEWVHLSQSLRDSPTRFACILAEKRSDKGFLPLPAQRPLRWFHEALVFEAPFRSLPP